MAHFSNRIPRLSEPNTLSLLIEAKRKSGEPWIDLSVSNPTEVDLEIPETAIRAALSQKPIGRYRPSPRGLLEARQAIAKHWSRGRGRVDPERLWITSGTSEAYGFLFKTLADPGDNVLIPTPSYPLFEHLLQAEGLVPRTYKLQYSGRWELDLESVKQTIDSRTRALILVHPNNPTGSYFTETEMHSIVELCARHQIPWISDEVFFEYPRDPGMRRTSFTDLGEDSFGFVLGGFSKFVGLPQMKVSWVYSTGRSQDAHLAAQKLDWLSDLYLSVNTTTLDAVPELLQEGEKIRTLIQDRVRTNGELLKTSGLNVLSAEGGWCSILRLEDQVDEEELALRLFEQDGVLVQPGYFFDLEFSASIVVSLLPQPKQFREGLQKLLKRLTR